MTIRRYSWIALSAALSHGGCYPAGIDRFEETDVVVTVKNPDTAYDTNRTYAMPDDVADLCGVVEEVPDSGLPEAGVVETVGDGGRLQFDPHDCREIRHDLDDVILGAIQSNMRLNGYTRVLPDANPDLVVLPGVVATRDWFAFEPYPWWAYWSAYPWGELGEASWELGYPVAGPVNFPAGTLVIEVVHLDGAEEGAMRLPVIWTAALRGLLEPSAAHTAARLRSGVNQAFAQSGYLRVAP